MKKFVLKRFSLLLFAMIVISCSSDNTNTSTTQTQFGIFRAVDQTTVEMNGEISSSTLTNFNSLIQNYPNINRINMINVPGSSDDDTNLQVSALVYQRNIDTHLADNGEIASGGTDFFLAGRTRTMGQNARIGVHSWSNGTQEATDFPVGHSEHQRYINYYVSVGFTQANAEAFYYYTINAAPASSIHWMTAAEIQQYGILR